MLDHVFDSIEAPPPDYLGDDRPVRPPRPVWIDLPGLFGSGTDADETVYPAGWAVGELVAGHLRCWARASTGAWIALVSYRFTRTGECGGGMMLTHWLPAALIRPRDTDR